jgi:hypothetical protein
LPGDLAPGLRPALIKPELNRVIPEELKDKRQHVSDEFDPGQPEVGGLKNLIGQFPVGSVGI